MFTKEVSINVYDDFHENPNILKNPYFISLLEDIFEDTQLLTKILNNVYVVKIYEDKINKNLNKLVFNINLMFKNQVNFFYNIKNELSKYKFFVIENSLSSLSKNNFISNVIIPITITKKVNIDSFTKHLISIISKQINLKNSTLNFEINFKTYFMNLDKKQHFIELKIVHYAPKHHSIFKTDVILVNNFYYEDKSNLEIIEFNLVGYDTENIKNVINTKYITNDYSYVITFSNENVKLVKLSILKNNKKDYEISIQNLDIKDNLYNLLKYILSYGIENEKYVNTNKVDNINKLFNRLIEEVKICMII